MQTQLMNQTQLEALVDLLVFATMTDKSFSDIETEVLDQDLLALPWTSGISVSSYKNASYARARAASSETAKANYLKQLCAVFDSAQVKQDAIATIEELLASDAVAATEDSFLERIKLELGLA
jgi:flavorubredoxin